MQKPETASWRELMHAVLNLDASRVGQLVDAGVRLDLYDDVQQSAVLKCWSDALWKGPEYVALGLKAGINANHMLYPEEPPLMYIAEHFPDMKNAAETVALLQKAGADVTCEGFHRTTLGRAVDCMHFDAVSALVGAGADINAPDSSGATPLMRAIIDGRDRMMTFLIDQGADLWRREPEHGKCILEWMIEGASNFDATEQTLRILISHGADMTVLPIGHINGMGKVTSTYDCLEQRAFGGKYFFEISQEKQRAEADLKQFKAEIPDVGKWFGENGKPTPECWRMVAFGHLPAMLEAEKWKATPYEALKLWNAVSPYYRQKHEDIDITYAYAAAPQMGGWQGVAVKSRQDTPFTGQQRR